MAPRHTPESLGRMIREAVNPLIADRVTLGQLRLETTLLAAEILADEPATPGLAGRSIIAFYTDTGEPVTLPTPALYRPAWTAIASHAFPGFPMDLMEAAYSAWLESDGDPAAATDTFIRQAAADAGFQRGDTITIDTNPDPWTGKRVRLHFPGDGAGRRLGTVVEVRMENGNAHSIGVEWNGHEEDEREWYSPSELVVVPDMRMDVPD